ncbi:ANTH-domain-containing protein [Delitschia confertaspora ATCC 74209]|uniref:ANTH-domain-containing protein n=1 Tax=Delitschia confertaspora ATCC 74209 TaxID=1513339 RepID=A0A9P4MUK6_9PLEO|nr:ANTH-domain-containing protein [Delitschia confertaspora ATCC 74209]
MASSFEKSVKGGTKIKLAAPKSKYVEHILVATHAGEAGVAEIFRALTNRLRDSTWTIVFKSLIIVHLMIREGEADVTLKYLAQNPQRKLAINHFTEVQTQGRNIKTYAEYLLRRAVEYGASRVDYVRGGEGRLKRLSVEKGLLRETESVQSQIRYLLRCELFNEDPENEITLTAFRLLTMDLLALFHVMNEGTINVLEHFFELSHSDASRALDIYKTFVKQTERVVHYLSVARLHEHSTRLEIPKIKHAPTSLAASLEEYLNDKDFEINRRQYVAEKEAKKGGSKTTNGTSHISESKPALSAPKPLTASEPPSAAKPASNAPLIDLFGSIQDNQQTMAQPNMAMQQYPQQTDFQQTGFHVPQQTANMGVQQPQQQLFGQQIGQGVNPFAQLQQPQQQTSQAQLQTQFTGAGFGSYTPQPFNPQSLPLASIPQNGVPNFSPQPTMGLAPISELSSQSTFQQHNMAEFQSQPTFQQSPISELSSQPTSTNPFRQSTMVPQATGAPEPRMLGNATGLARSPTNPFAKQNTFQQPQPLQAPGLSTSPFSIPQILSPPSTSPFAPQQQQSSLQPTPTGTNPFARHASPQQNIPSPQGGLTVNATGSTNPFRQSAFVNQQTGQGWQNSAGQNTLGGMSVDQVDTYSVFPRPGQQQQTGQSGGQGWT